MSRNRLFAFEQLCDDQLGVNASNRRELRDALVQDAAVQEVVPWPLHEQGPELADVGLVFGHGVLDIRRGNA